MKPPEQAVSEMVHIAGVDVQVGAQLRQRCSWCGVVLIDYDLERMAFSLEPATWPIGGLVAVGGGAKWIVDHADGDKLPETACAQLPHDLTGAP